MLGKKHSDETGKKSQSGTKKSSNERKTFVRDKKENIQAGKE